MSLHGNEQCTCPVWDPWSPWVSQKGPCCHSATTHPWAVPAGAESGLVCGHRGRGSNCSQSCTNSSAPGAGCDWNLAVSENPGQGKCSHYTPAMWQLHYLEVAGNNSSKNPQDLKTGMPLNYSWSYGEYWHLGAQGGSVLRGEIKNWPARICLLVLLPMQQGSGKLCYIPVVCALSFPSAICYTDLFKRKIKSLIHCCCVNRIPLRALACLVKEHNMPLKQKDASSFGTKEQWKSNATHLCHVCSKPGDSPREWMELKDHPLVCARLGEDIVRQKLYFKTSFT